MGCYSNNKLPNPCDFKKWQMLISHSPSMSSRVKLGLCSLLPSLGAPIVKSSHHLELCWLLGRRVLPEPYCPVELSGRWKCSLSVLSYKVAISHMQSLSTSKCGLYNWGTEFSILFHCNSHMWQLLSWTLQHQRDLPWQLNVPSLYFQWELTGHSCSHGLGKDEGAMKLHLTTCLKLENGKYLVDSSNTDLGE